MSTIPAKAIVAVTPNVLAAGGLGLALNGVMITLNDQVPIGAVQPFSNQLDVADYFGSSSVEADLAARYFSGFINSNIKPGRLYYAQYPQAAVGAYLRGGPVNVLSLADLGGLSGSLTVLLDGYTHTGSSINLAGCTSYSNAASIINSGLFATEPTEATCSLGTISGTTLTVAGSLTGTFAPGQTISGTSVTVGSLILAQLTGTIGGLGTYSLSASSTVGSGEVITAKATAGTVTYDSVSGAFVVSSGITGAPSTAAYATGTLAASIFLTSATGAVLSQGAAAATPAGFMNGIVATTQNWASFMTIFDPDGGSGNDVKFAFAEWEALQDNRWTYVCWDTDASPLTQVPASSSLGALLDAATIGGVQLIYAPDTTTGPQLAAFNMGIAASLDFTQRNGRATFAFKRQAGITASVTTQTAMDNLIANGYNFYGAYATANEDFIWYYPGSVSGDFKWADSYVNQIWLNAEFQLDLMILLQEVKSVPYNAAGYALIQAAVGSTIQAALNFGVFSPGVQLSSLQQAEVNNAAGIDLTAILFQQGWYFQVLPASAETRANRTSPPCTFWYTDAGAVQKINLASVLIQ